MQSKNRARPMAARLKKINPVQSKNRARPMAARSAHGRAVKKKIKKNKPRVKHEPRSAHGRAVNYQDMETAKNVQRSRSLFRRLKVEGKGYSPDVFSELQREPTQLTKFGA